MTNDPTAIGVVPPVNGGVRKQHYRLSDGYSTSKHALIIASTYYDKSHPPCQSFLQAGAFKRATSEPFSLAAVAGGTVWKNAAGQLSFLQYAVAAPPEVFTFKHAARKQLPLQGLPEYVLIHTPFTI